MDRSSQENGFSLAAAICHASIFFGSVDRSEQLAFLDVKLRVNHELIQKLKDNYRNNGDFFAQTTGLYEGDRRLDSATYACRWGILRSEEYGKLLEEIKAEILEGKEYQLRMD